MVDDEFEVKRKEAMLVWRWSSVIAVIGISLLSWLSLSGIQINPFLNIALWLLTIGFGGYSLWLLLMFTSGLVWSVLRNLNPIIAIPLVILIPPLLILSVIGWFLTEDR